MAPKIASRHVKQKLVTPVDTKPNYPLKLLDNHSTSCKACDFAWESKSEPCASKEAGQGAPASVRENSCPCSPWRCSGTKQSLHPLDKSRCKVSVSWDITEKDVVSFSATLIFNDLSPGNTDGDQTYGETVEQIRLVRASTSRRLS